MSQYNVICSKCKNFNTGKLSFTCKAFPDGIPDDILTEDFIHKKIHPKQKNKILFEPIEMVD